MTKELVTRIAAYLRTSTERQKHEGTIESQKDSVVQYVLKHYPYIKSTDIIFYEDEAWPSNTLERPQMDELRLSLTEDTWDVLIVPDPDRLAREPYLQVLVLEEVEKAGKQIEFCETAAPNSENPDDMMMFEFRAMMSKYEKVRINSRFRVGKLRRARSGKLMLSTPPYGYSLIKRHEHPKTKAIIETEMVINEKEAEAVRKIFHWYTHEKLSMRKICARLKEEGIKPRKNKLGNWNTSSIKNMLSNETYIGLAYYNRSKAVEPKKSIRKLRTKFQKNPRTSRIYRPKEEWLQSTVPAIFDSPQDQDMFYKAQDQRVKNARVNNRKRKNDYLLAGTIYCTCGAARTGEGPKAGRYLYYRCGSRHNNQTTANSKCGLMGVNARIADKAVWDAVSKILADTGALRTQLSCYYKQDNNDSLQLRITELDDAASKIELRLQELYGHVITEELDVHEYKAIKNTADAQLKEIHSKLKGLEKRSVASEKNIITPEQFENILATATIKLNDLNFKQKTDIVGQLIDEVIAEPGQLTVTGYIGLSSSSETQELEGTNYSSNTEEIYVNNKVSGRNCWVTQRR
jgi:site-specific DNA recombinase